MQAVPNPASAASTQPVLALLLSKLVVHPGTESYTAQCQPNTPEEGGREHITV